MNAILRQAYRMFKLFHGTFEGVVRRSNVGVLREKLSSFFAGYLPRMDLEEADLLSALDGIHFLPLDKSLYLRVQSVINYTEQAFPDISYTCFFYTHHLAWSGLEQDDIRVLYRYLNTALAPATGRREEDAQQGKKRAPVFGRQDALYARGNSQKTMFPCLHCSDSFVMGAENLNERDAPVNPQRVYVGTDSCEHHLIIFQVRCSASACTVKSDATCLQLGDVTMVFLLAATSASMSKVVDSNYYKALYTHLRPQLSELNTLIGRQQARKPLYVCDYAYFYYEANKLAVGRRVRIGTFTLTT